MRETNTILGTNFEVFVVNIGQISQVIKLFVDVRMYGRHTWVPIY